MINYHLQSIFATKMLFAVFKNYNYIFQLQMIFFSCKNLLQMITFVCNLSLGLKKIIAKG